MSPTTTTANQFSRDEVDRYSRQMVLPEVGVRGQTQLRGSSALIVGVGGLGCPAAMYLAGAGIGTLGLVDRPGDVVEVSNLHRQLAHCTERVGMDKVESAATAIRATNPFVNIQTHVEFTSAVAEKLVASYDVVLDCTDNVASRYLVGDACAVSRTPLVSGSAIGLEGQLTVYCLDDDTPCYRCVFPMPPPPICVGSCASAGVLGPVPGTIGTLQALEAIKLLAKVDRATCLAGQMLLFDGAEMTFRKVKLRSRSKTCAACGDVPSVRVNEVNYESFANGNGSAGVKKSPLPGEWRISVAEFQQMRTGIGEKELPYLLLDIRPNEQFELSSFSEGIHVPMTELEKDPLKVEDVKAAAGRGKQVVVLCRRGNQSQDCVRLLRDSGMGDVVDIVGGCQAWQKEIDPSFHVLL